MSSHASDDARSPDDDSADAGASARDGASRAPVRRAPVAVVSGGSAGIGRATARLLAERGYAVAVLARGQERLDETVRELEAHGGEALGIACDVADGQAVADAHARVSAELGTPLVWVNSAMLTAFSPFEEMGEAEFRRIVEVTFLGQVNGTRAALGGMRRLGRGSIVNIGSGLSYRSVPLQSAYCASKAAINGFTASLRSELIHEGFDDIRLSLVQLPAVNTPQFDWARSRLDRVPRPAAPVYQPEVAARAVLQAVDEGARELFVGRSVPALVLGNMLAPAALDRKLADAGWDGQYSDEPAPGDRSGNLERASTRDVAAHGSWDEEASAEGLIVDADKLRYAVAGGLGLAAFGAGLLAASLLGRRR